MGISKAGTFRTWARRQPGWYPWWTLVLSAFLLSMRLSRGPDDAFGGPVAHYVVVSATGVMLALSIVVLVSRRGR